LEDYPCETGKEANQCQVFEFSNAIRLHAGEFYGWKILIFAKV
jgi:hypothetical protein